VTYFMQSAQLLTVEQAARFLNLSKSYLYKLVCQKKIPYYKPFGGKIYFIQDELESYVKASRCPAAHETIERAIDLLNNHSRKRPRVIKKPPLKDDSCLNGGSK